MTLDAPKAFISSNLDGAPLACANCIVALPTPPEAPETNRISFSFTCDLVSKFSDVEYEHGNDASSISLYSLLISCACSFEMIVNCAKPPSHSLPKYHGFYNCSPFTFCVMVQSILVVQF